LELGLNGKNHDLGKDARMKHYLEGEEMMVSQVSSPKNCSKKKSSAKTK